MTRNGGNYVVDESRHSEQRSREHKTNMRKKEIIEATTPCCSTLIACSASGEDGRSGIARVTDSAWTTGLVAGPCTYPENLEGSHVEPQGQREQ